jgi:hypothetical protein
VSQCDPFYGSLCYIFGLIIYIFENNQYICATINKSMNISSELKNVNFTTPGTTPMYEMLLFFHHWREDFKNDNMLNAFMEKAKSLLEKEYICLQSAYNLGKSSKEFAVYRDAYKKNYPVNSRNLELKPERKYDDLNFAKLNPEE